jgi:class 3 adenylate cyclase
MNTTDLTRRLSAILSADVEGYSRLMRDDEEATVHTITTYRTAMTHLINQYRGRVVDSPGDNILAEFTSVPDVKSSVFCFYGSIFYQRGSLRATRLYDLTPLHTLLAISRRIPYNAILSLTLQRKRGAHISAAPS